MRREQVSESKNPTSPSTIRPSPIDIELRQITKSFGAQIAVNSLSLTISQGEFFCLLGPSGCGKTTTLNTIAGFLRPESGEILFNRVPITGVPVHKRNIGIVFQSYALFPHLTTYENIAFGLRRRRLSAPEEKRRVADVVKMVHLEGNEDRYPNQLSGGQQQRVALARALVIQPSVLLLDEPLSNLDAKLREQMRLELRRIQKAAGVTTVFVTHDQEEALSMADRVAVMKSGVLQQIACPQEIYHRPANQFVASFIGQANLLVGRVIARESDGLIVETALGPIKAKSRSKAPAPPDDQVTIMIRPERININAVAPDSHQASAIIGTVRTLVFRGAAVQFEVSVKGENLTALAAASSQGTRLAVGDDVSLTWDPADVVVLQNEEGV
jgi:spermidine/putrescine ABC transporter ATP-binding subunit